MTQLLDALGQPHVQLLLRLVLGGLLLLAGVTKLADRESFRQAVAEGLPVPAHVLAEYGLTDDVPASGPTPPTAPEPLQLALFAPS